MLRNGRGANMDPHHPLAREDYIVAAEVGGHGRAARIFLAAPIAIATIEQHFATQIERRAEVRWDDESHAVVAIERRMLGALTLSERPLRDVPQSAITAALLDAIRRNGIAALPWSREAARLRQRLAFLHALDDSDWPDVSDAALLDRLDDWLAPWLGNARSLADVQRVDFAEALVTGLSWELRSRIDELAPTHIVVPSGSRIPIDYEDTRSPVLAVRLQEMFGLERTPAIADARVPLTLQLLSPAHRPVQVTRDLASFWRTTYFDVRRDLRGRYPKHYWPDDPLQAEPTRRTRPRP
jgi:ATP-dependent helicase HrpB